MKKLILLLFVTVSFMSCDNDDNSNNEQSNNTIIGRWHLVGFENNTLYDFKDDGLRYTIYSDGNGVFGPTETSALPTRNEWVIENNQITIDLHFGNELIRNLNFKNNGNVVEFIDENGNVTHTHFREGYNYTN